MYVGQRFKKLLFGPDYYWFQSNYFSLVYLKQLNYNENKDNVKCRSEWPHVWFGFSDWLRCREHLGQPFMLTNTPLTSLKLTLHGCFLTSLQAQREHENSTQKGTSRPIQPSLTLYPVQLFSNTIRLFLRLPRFHKSAVEEDKMPQRRIRTLAGTSPCVQSRNSFGGQTQTAALLSMHWKGSPEQ